MGARKVAQVSAVLVVLVAIATQTFLKALFSLAEGGLGSLCYGKSTTMFFTMISFIV